MSEKKHKPYLKCLLNLYNKLINLLNKIWRKVQKCEKTLYKENDVRKCVFFCWYKRNCQFVTNMDTATHPSEMIILSKKCPVLGGGKCDCIK